MGSNVRRDLVDRRYVERCRRAPAGNRSIPGDPSRAFCACHVNGDRHDCRGDELGEVFTGDVELSAYRHRGEFECAPDRGQRCQRDVAGRREICTEQRAALKTTRQTDRSHAAVQDAKIGPDKDTPRVTSPMITMYISDLQLLGLL